MLKCLGIRLAASDSRRIHAAASAQGLSVNVFVRTVVMATVREIECRLPGGREPDPTHFVLIGARNGPPGYRRRGIEFGHWLVRNKQAALGHLHQLLAVADAEMLRREGFKSICGWCCEHFPGLMIHIPRRRQLLFVCGILEAVKG